MEEIVQLVSRPSIAALTTLTITWIVYLFGLATYRLYFSPLAKIPGPKLASLTGWYEFYYEVILRGQFTFKIQELHKKYGPIIRITPFEVHIEDSDFWDELYSRSNRYDKYEWMAGRFGNNSSSFTTSSSALHAIRRAPLNHMFSKRSILQIEPLIQKKVQLLCDGITKIRNQDKVLTLSHAYSAFAGDVITTYCFGFCYDHLESRGFCENFSAAYIAVSAFGHLALQYPMMHPIMNSFPDSMTLKMTPDLHMLLMLQKDLRTKIGNIISGTDDVKYDHPTILLELLESDLPPREKAINRLGDEAQLFLGAGLETTAWALSTMSFYILANPLILKRLQAELKEAIPDLNNIPGLLVLEKLPYLGACIQEGIRLSHGVSARHPRINPDGPIVYKNWSIPAGVPVSMTAVDVHQDEHIYPNSGEFIPERFLDNPRTSSGEPLSHYFVAFGKGPRSCLGINLAFAELCMAGATVFRRFEFELYETDVSDVLLAHDFFLPSPKLDSKGVRVKVVSVAS